MPQVIISLDKEENGIVREYGHKWNLSKHETIRRIILEWGSLEFEEEEEE